MSEVETLAQRRVNAKKRSFARRNFQKDFMKMSERAKAQTLESKRRLYVSQRGK